STGRDYLCGAMRKITRILSLFVGIMLFTVMGLMAQVPATSAIDVSRSDRPARVMINWQAADEAAWNTLQGGRLDVMGVRARLGSGQFGPSAKAEIVFQLDIPSGRET